MSWFRRLSEAPLTVALIAVNLIVFVAMVVTSRRVVSFDSDILRGAGAMYFDPGEPSASPWRWLTAAFIHVNLLHIIMNMWVLGQIGIISERALGRGLFAVSYVVTGMLGNVVSGTLAAARGTPLVSAGASGAIMGLIGMAAAFAWLSGQRAVAKAMAINILFVLGVGLSLTFRGRPMVDNAAHIGGLAAGVGLGVARFRMPRPLPNWLDRGLIAWVLLLAALAFAVIALGGADRVVNAV
jgi:rhomboid protease GluP